jgi:Lrp/AsnC family transcriptional regulator for asnA, asnC and gidA
MGDTKKLDSLDKKLIYYLSQDGRMPVKKLVEELEITSPTLQVRIKNLLQSGVFKIAGLIDVFKIEKLFMALVAIRVIDDSKIDKTLNDLAELQEVDSVYAVTGRYDIFAEILFSNNMEELYSFMSTKLPQQGNIDHSESFVVLKSKKKWTLLPPGIKL